MRSVRFSVGGAFSPNSISGNVLWFDFKDPASFTATSSLDTVVNKASGVTWSTFVTNPPGFSSTAYNGVNPAITFNGSSQGIGSTEAAVADVFSNNNPFTLVMRVLGGADATDVWFSAADSASPTANYRWFGMQTAGVGRQSTSTSDNTGTVITTTDTVDYDRGAHTLIWVNNGNASSNMFLYQDGVLTGIAGTTHVPANPLTPNRSAFGVLYDSTPGSQGSFTLAEALIYNSALDASLIQMITSYMNRWA